MSTPKKQPTQQEKKPPQAASQRRYPPDLKDRAVRMVHQLRREDPGDQGVINRVARQLGVGKESLRAWVKQVLAATLSAHGAAGLVGDGSATLHGDEFSGMTTVGPKAGRGVIVW